MVHSMSLQTCRGRRYLLPDFETFVVGVLRVDQPGVRCVYDLRTRLAEDTWLHRGRWLPPLLEGFEDSNRQRRQAVEAFSRAPWQFLQGLSCCESRYGVSLAYMFSKTQLL